MVYGYNRLPIVSWLKGNAEEGLAHAQRAGEMVTLLGGHPSLKSGALLEERLRAMGAAVSRVRSSGTMRRPAWPTT